MPQQKGDLIRKILKTLIKLKFPQYGHIEISFRDYIPQSLQVHERPSKFVIK